MKIIELKVPPVVVMAVVAAAMMLASKVTPYLEVGLPGRRVIALVLVLTGAFVALSGVVSFVRASTTVDPMRPETASSLVVTGVYRHTRNPMYLGLLLALVGWGIWLSNPLSVLIVPAFVVYMNRFQIIPEERALRAQFGRDFEEYAQSVRRWL